MTPGEVLGKIFANELDKIYLREREKEEFLNSDDFDSQEQRIDAALGAAMTQVKKVLLLHVLKDHQKRKGEEAGDKIAMLSNEIDPAYQELTASDGEWWTL